jgi:hypothetical protein
METIPDCAPIAKRRIRVASFCIILHLFSRHGQFIKDFLDDRFAGFFPGPGRDGHAWPVKY